MIIGVVGLGLIGQQRLESLLRLKNVSEVVLFDSDFQKLKKLIRNGNFEDKTVSIASNLEYFFSKNLDGVIICTPHEALFSYAEICLQKNLKILIEKPGAINLNELNRLKQKQNFELVSVGYNYRFMPGIIQLLDVVKKNDLGNLISIEIYLGHGGSPKDFDTWKLKRKSAGGGVLLDPGVHILDLIVNKLSTIGDLAINDVSTWKGFWNTDIEEHAVIQGRIGKILINITLSIVTWKTKFNFKISGTESYFELSGRGRTDGAQKVVRGERWAWLQGDSQEKMEKTQIVMPQDESLHLETQAWIEKSSNVASLNDAIKIMETYEMIEQKSK
jgi:predicted dehydrogenase